MLLGPDDVALHRQTVLQIEELFEMLIHMGDGTQEDADILDDVRYVGRDAVNILPHIKLALGRDAEPRGQQADDA